MIRLVLSTFLSLMIFENRAIGQTAPIIRTYFVHVDPRGTYLPYDHQYDSPNPATRFDLSILYNDPEVMLRPGDLIGLQEVGAFAYNGHSGPVANGLLGVFSGGGNLLFPGPGGFPSFVVGIPTCAGPIRLPSDVPQDFFIAQSLMVLVEVPQGADSLLFTSGDCLYADNTDPTGGYGLTIQVTVIKQSFSVTLAKSEVYPAKTSGDNRTTVRAQINGGGTQNGAGLGGKLIQFTSLPIELSGGHKHTGIRPIGTFNPPSCMTDDSGSCSVDYYASEVAGTETISAILNGNPIQQDSKDLTVKVPDLADMSGAVLAFFGVTGDQIYDLVGQLGSHPSNHFLNASSQLAIFGVAYDFQNEFHARLGLNDMSLESGGLFDIGPTIQFPSGRFWDTPHKLHREGTGIDIAKCASSTVENNSNNGVGCDPGFVKVPKLRFGRICRTWGGHLEAEPQIHCEFKPKGI